MAVIIKIGIMFLISCQPTSTNTGRTIIKETTSPFRAPFIFRFTAEIIKPAPAHIQNAEILASQVSFCSIIGITSTIPAKQPSKKPVIFL
ncbi:MAG: hypothetical protein A2252_04660 [Elusimicrobia bacterium RIFOXYA2_FULL_39_19]|nr:MAG: hypothetical protein A2252_04660 [Elusimicrobia bacterium RIFOXYA2_FULL_39_19]